MAFDVENVQNAMLTLNASAAFNDFINNAAISRMGSAIDVVWRN